MSTKSKLTDTEVDKMAAQPLRLTSRYANREVLGENPHAMDAEGREWWLDDPYGGLLDADDRTSRLSGRWVCITCGLHVDWPNERNWHYVSNWDHAGPRDGDLWAHDSPQCVTLVYPAMDMTTPAPSGWDEDE